MAKHIFGQHFPKNYLQNIRPKRSLLVHVNIHQQTSHVAMASEGTNQKKLPRFLCLHGFRTSGAILKKQIFDKWPTQVVDKLDLVFIDAPFPCQGKSEVEGIFDPPYYEWYQFNKDLKVYENFDKCLEYIEECMIKHGPFDGLLGFSQGAIISGGLPGLQDKGVGLTKVPKIKYLIIIGGAKLQDNSVAEKAYSSPITCPSVHFLGEQDYLKKYGMELLELYVDPVVIHHPKGHTIPRFDEKGLESMLSFIEKVQAEINK
ncbi:esterase OVCA2 isoform X2 [Capsicum chacoense]|uniref:Serine hydrolase domain-containing protein n=1 Tax=Capsicum annuum TaxID=4072 RepID=A0A1U8GK54_CAPAN|nr:esterase OVCA2 isoform X2 [Capsicum annuum]KAF3633496.1 putative bet1-like protein-like [Capsicum annuum]PHT84319.1 hypothetical protein T459_12762 [Capsicum annuum]